VPRSTRSNALTFEEIPPELRPAIVAHYLQLLDAGFRVERITFRRYGHVLRAVATYPDGTVGSTLPTCPRPAPAAEAAIAPDSLDREARAALTQQRREAIAALEGIRVRASWSGGHERIGVITRRDQYTFRLTDIESLRLHPSDQLPALEPIAPKAAHREPSAPVAMSGAA
jgi:hypothetical protein